MFVTSRQILDELGIRNIKTLTRWYQIGVIPEPEIKSHEGVGRIACWPQWVLKHCGTIQKLTAQGQTLKAISEEFGNNWDEIGRRYRTYSFKKGSENKREAELLHDIADAVNDAISYNLVTMRQQIHDKRAPIVDMEIVVEAIELAKLGHNPVLLIAPPFRVLVIPDFLVSRYLSENYSISEGLFVIPIFSICKQLCPQGAIPVAPRTKPVAKVVNGKGVSAQESTFRMTKSWNFEILPNEPASRRPKPTKKKK